MPVDPEGDFRDQIIRVLEHYSGTKNISLEQMISRDVGIYGGDGVQVLDELEDMFNVDLEPLVQQNTTYGHLSWVGRLFGRKRGRAICDFTVQELVNYIAMRK